MSLQRKRNCVISENNLLISYIIGGLIRVTEQRTKPLYIVY